MKHSFSAGDGVSFGFNGDRNPGTVVKVTSARIWVREDSWVCTKPMSAYGADDAEYEFSENPNGTVLMFSVLKNGSIKWKDFYHLSAGRSYRRNPHF